METDGVVCLDAVGSIALVHGGRRYLWADMTLHSAKEFDLLDGDEIAKKPAQKRTDADWADDRAFTARARKLCRRA